MLREEAKSGALRALLGSGRPAFEVRRLRAFSEVHLLWVASAHPPRVRLVHADAPRWLLYDRAGDSEGVGGKRGSGQERDAKQSRGKIVVMSLHLVFLLPEVTRHTMMTDTTDFFFFF